MTSTAIIELLSYAQGHECAVQLRLSDGSEVRGFPSSIDTHPTAYEVYLHPVWDDPTEVGVSLTEIVSVEMIAS